MSKVSIKKIEEILEILSLDDVVEINNIDRKVADTLTTIFSEKYNVLTKTSINYETGEQEYILHVRKRGILK